MDARYKSMDAPTCPGCAARNRRIAQLEAQSASLEQRITKLEEQLAVATRASKRQAAPFSKGPPKANPRTPGRKPGKDYGPKAFRPVPPVIDEVYAAPLPKRCPCGGVVLLEQVVPQYQTEIPRRPIYRQFNVHNPSRFKGAKNPVGKVSWDDCQACLDKLNAKAGGQGGKFALPTETQWEYACRAGSTQSYSFGDQESRLGEYGWFDGNSGSKTHPVGEKKPNAAGLYDMHGNVWEWCQDWYGAYGAEAVTDPSGPTSGSNRVVRGGSQGDPGVFSRSSKRADNQPGLRWNDLGFRVSRVPAE